MRKIYIFFIIGFCLIKISAASSLPIQTATVSPELQRLVDTELSFAKTAAEKGTKSAFLEFLADDGVMFQPDAVNGKTYWNGRGESAGLLTWHPVFADISASGVLGYTTGPWSFSPKKEENNSTAFGDFITVWQKQADGSFKFVLDIGISHDKPKTVETDWKTSTDKGTENKSKQPVSASSNMFYDLAVNKNLAEAYKMYAAEDIRVYREGKMPLLGKANALAEVKKDKSAVSFGKKMTLQSAGDLAFSNVTYQSTKGKTTEKGNTVQIWKFRDGRWQIVLDVFSPIPETKK